VAVNLGGIIALSDQKVVILDLDLRKPKVNIAFDAENNIGVSTILIEKHSVQECIQKTAVENLHFIPAGPTPPNPSELILNPKFDDMLAELYQLYDVIIVDTPPIGLVTDGILVMRKADIPIYIVRADYSKKIFLKSINKIMRSNNFKNLTVVLNDARGASAYGYGYGYGYGYEYGYGNSYYDEEEKEGLLTRLRRNFT
jgi:tyrosine-protein kinase Etk/Wzc